MLTVGLGSAAATATPAAGAATAGDYIVVLRRGADAGAPQAQTGAANRVYTTAVTGYEAMLSDAQSGAGREPRVTIIT